MEVEESLLDFRESLLEVRESVASKSIGWKQECWLEVSVLGRSKSICSR